MRLFISVLSATAMFLAAATAGAIDFTVSNLTSSAGGVAGNTVTLTPGDVGATISFDITMRNTGGTDLGAFGASIVGYNLDGNAATNVVNFAGPSGNTGAQLFSTTAFGTMAFGGVGNSQAAPAETTVSVETFVRLASVFNTTVGGGSGTGELDIGISGVAGDLSPHFSVSFVLTGLPGDVNLGIGVLGEGDAASSVAGQVLTNNNTNVLISVVPEPGTALLMGLGLAGLAAAGRRE